MRTSVSPLVLSALLLVACSSTLAATKPDPPTPWGPGSPTGGNASISSDTFSVTFSLGNTDAPNAQLQVFRVGQSQPVYDSNVFVPFSPLGIVNMSFATSYLPGNGNYYWQARSKDNKTTLLSDWSTPYYFTLTLVPAIPGVTSPGNLSPGTSVSIPSTGLPFVLSLVNAPVSITSISVTVNDDTNSAQAYSSGQVSGSTVTVPQSTFTNGHRYSWYGVAYGGDQQSAHTNTYYFTASIAQTITAQTVSLEASKTSISSGEAVTFTASGSNTGYSWTVPSGVTGYQANSSRQTLTFPNAGTFDVTVAAPASGSYGAADPKTVTIHVSAGLLQQRTVKIDPAVTSVAQNGNVTFTASGGDGTGEYIWGGAAAGKPNGTQVTVTFPTPNVSTFVNVYRAADATYAASNTAEAHISVDASPTAQTISLVASQTAIDTGGIVTFTASGSATGYTWSIPAGLSVTSPSADVRKVTFASAGSYQVSATAPASGSYAQSQPAVVTITVTDPAPGKFTAKQYVVAATSDYNVREYTAGTVSTTNKFLQTGGVVGQIGQSIGKPSNFPGTGTWYTVSWDDVAPTMLGKVCVMTEDGLRALPSVVDLGSLPAVNWSSNAYSFDNQFYKSGQAPTANPLASNFWPQSRGNCTWYAYGRMLELGYSSSALYAVGIGFATPHLAAAQYWPDNARLARAQGVTAPGSIPVLQSIACAPNEHHVAVVEWVSSDKTMFLVSESAYVDPTTTTRTDISIDPWNTKWRRRLVYQSSGEFTAFIVLPKATATAQTLLGTTANKTTSSVRALVTSGANIAATVNSGNTAGTIVGYLPSIASGFSANFAITNGSFSTVTSAIGAGGVSGQQLTLSGTFANGVLSGNIAELGLGFSAQVDPANGSTTSVAGLYQSAGTNGVATYSVVGTQGNVFVLAVTAAGVGAGTGTVNPDSSFNVTTNYGTSATITGTIDTGAAAIASTVTASGGAALVLSGVQVSAAPAFTSVPQDQTVPTGGPVTLSAEVAGSGLTYQWLHNGQVLPGATSAAYTISAARASDGGDYTLSVLNLAGTVTSPVARISVLQPAARLVNMSIRSGVASGTDTLIAGFVITGSGKKQVLVRAIGPSLAAFHVSSPLQLPLLTLFDAQSKPVSANSGWGGAPSMSAMFSSLGAFPLATTSNDCALLASLNPGLNSAQITGVAGSTGAALAEVYEADANMGARLSNMSARAAITGGSNATLIVGFVISGTGNETLLVRGVGPGLAQFGLTGTLTTPELVVYDAGSVPIVSNAGWTTVPVRGASSVVATYSQVSGSQMTSLGAFPIASGSADCALMVTLPPGGYSAVVSGLNNTTGVALVELYEVPAP